MEGAAKVIKFLVVFFNFIFFVFGCVLIGVGAYTLAKFGDYVTLTESIPYASGSKVMIAAGVLVAIISFLGCCGAWKENRCMLVIFFICLLVILGLEIAAAVLGYQHRGDLDDKLDTDVLRELREHYGEKGHEGTTTAWDNLQQSEACCGWKNYTDWYQSKWELKNKGLPYVPDSCCKDKKAKCGEDIKNINTAPCQEKLRTLLKGNLYTIGAVGITIVVIQILGMIFALVLIVKIGQAGTYA